MENFLWTCPFCNRDTTITEDDCNRNEYSHNNKNYGTVWFITEVIVCPNAKCREVCYRAKLDRREYDDDFPVLLMVVENLYNWSLIPQSRCRIFPDYIPQQLQEDYKEACAILSLSPKASATLSRRCLQGMLRDFWGVKNKRNLRDEINEIQDKIEPEVWYAIDAIRKIGNIGAHMEKEVDLIINVDPGEAEKLIELIEMLFEEWYINRHHRQERLLKLKQIAEQKDIQKIEVSI